MGTSKRCRLRIWGWQTPARASADEAVHSCGITCRASVKCVHSLPKCRDRRLHHCSREEPGGGSRAIACRTPSITCSPPSASVCSTCAGDRTLKLETLFTIYQGDTPVPSPPPCIAHSSFPAVWVPTFCPVHSADVMVRCHTFG